MQRIVTLNEKGDSTMNVVTFARQILAMERELELLRESNRT